jgi:hypothetical protein
MERFIQDDPVEFDAGDVCGFPVLIDPDLRVRFTTFSDRRSLINVKGTQQVTNTLTGESASLHIAGSVADTQLPNGDFRSTSRGRNLLLYFPGDVSGPGLFLTKGQVVDIFDATTGAVKSTRLNGQRTDICALLS